MTKSLFASKTFWFNVLSFVVLIASAFGYKDFKPDAGVVNSLAVVIPIINIALRYVTKQPISL